MERILTPSQLKAVVPYSISHLARLERAGDVRFRRDIPAGWVFILEPE